MDNRTDISLPEQFAAALDWWRDAGVDCDFADEVQQWLAEPEPEATQTPSPRTSAAPFEERAPAIVASALPQDLDAFQTWWVDAASPLPAGPSPRVPPRGSKGAKLMLLVPMPEAGDSAQLLSGPQGEMLGNIAKALKFALEETYLASALPTHTPLPDWDALAAEGLGAAVRHHVKLAEPERVLLFGTKLPALLGFTGSPEQMDRIGGIPALASFAPERLLDHKRQRARLWERLQQWTAA